MKNQCNWTALLKRYFMHKKYLATGIFFAALAVALGAFGAHGLQKLTDDAKILSGYHTAVQYQMWHALALIITGILYLSDISRKQLHWAAGCFTGGIILFSGSLYLLTFLKMNESGLTKVTGPFTPLGGVFFIAGWLLLLIAVLKKDKS